MIIADKITEDFYNDGQDVTDAVKEIIADVRKNGNSAVKKYSEKFDGIETDCRELSEDEIENAVKSLDDEVLEALKFSVRNVEEFAKAQLGSVKNTMVQALSLIHI